MVNKPINLAEAKRRFSDLVGRVAYGGEEIVIARRGRPVARLVPLRPAAPHLATVAGWLPDDDPLFAALDRIAAERGRHVPRVARRRPR